MCMCVSVCICVYVSSVCTSLIAEISLNSGRNSPWKCCKSSTENVEATVEESYGTSICCSICAGSCFLLIIVQYCLGLR